MDTKQVVQGNPYRAAVGLIIAALCGLGCLEVYNHVSIGTTMRPWLVSGDYIVPEDVVEQVVNERIRGMTTDELAKRKRR